jgi:16S rRNA processing protein RimM
MAMDPESVVVAEILRPRGIRGELLAVSQTDVPGRFETLKKAKARLAGGSEMPVEIESVWAHKDLWVLKFAGVDSIDAAERFRGAELCVPLSERGKLADGEYFQSDLIGFEVIEKATGKILGSVAGWRQYGGPPLMEVQADGCEVLIPFVPSICLQIDVAGGKILVDLPEGLLEL